MTIQHTPNYDLPYPQASDPADGPAQIGGLANATEAALQTLDNTGVANSKHPRARMRVLDAQPIPPSDWFAGSPVYTQIDFTEVAEDYNRGTPICDLANNRLVIPETGLWAISGLQVINNVTAAGGYLIHSVRVSASPIVHVVQPLFNIANYVLGHRVYHLAAGSFLTMWASTNVLGVQTIRSSSAQAPSLEATFIGITP